MTNGRRVFPTHDCERRFWVKVDIDLTTGACWLWKPTADKPGYRYGTFWLTKDHCRGAHRIAYEALKGPIPDGLELDHLCREPACVNPAHLEPVTHAENQRRGNSGANWAAKTHCPQGHPYDSANTVVYNGGRNCRICRNASRRRWRARRRLEGVS